MTDGGSSPERRSNRLELVAAILQGLAAVLTAWAAYRASLVDDEVLAGYSESLASVSEANDTFSLGDQQQSLEQNLFLQYAVQLSVGNDDGAAYLFAAMSPELQDVVIIWENDPSIETPTPTEDKSAFADLGSQVLYALGDEILAGAAVFQAEPEDADRKSDVFGLAEVFFAITLFVAGFASLLRQPRLQLGVLILACVILVSGLAVLIGAEATVTSAAALGSSPPWR